MTAFWQSDDERFTLHTGDCLDVLRTIEPQSVDVVWCDPPFFLSGKGSTCKSGKRAKVSKGAWDKPMTPMNQLTWNRNWLELARCVLKPTGTIWICGSMHSVYSTGVALQLDHWRILNEIVWEKPNPPPNLGRRCYVHSHESLIWASLGKGAKHHFEYDLMRDINCGKQMKDVWQFTAPPKSEKEFGKHPTQKPIALIARSLLASVPPGGVALDAFAGAGSTGVAVAKANRASPSQPRGWSYIGIEIDPEWNEVAKRRIQDALKKPAAEAM